MRKLSSIPFFSNLKPFALLHRLTPYGGFDDSLKSLLLRCIRFSVIEAQQEVRPIPPHLYALHVNLFSLLPVSLIFKGSSIITAVKIKNFLAKIALIYYNCV